MWPVPLFAFSVVLLVIAFWRGCVGIYGAAVYRTENPLLYWGQMTILVVATAFLGFTIVRG